MQGYYQRTKRNNYFYTLFGKNQSLYL